MLINITIGRYTYLGVDVNSATKEGPVENPPNVHSGGLPRNANVRSFQILGYSHK